MFPHIAPFGYSKEIYIQVNKTNSKDTVLHTFFKASSLYRRRAAPAEFAALPLASFDDCFLPALALTTYLQDR